MFYDDIIFLILRILLIPILIIGVIIYFIVRHRKHAATNPYFKIALSKDDALSQFYFLLANFFLSLTLYALNRDFGINLAWEWIFLVSALVGLAIGYAYKAVLNLAFAVIAVAIWWGMEAVKHTNGISGVGVLVGFLLITQIVYLLGRIQQVSARFKREAVVFIVLALVVVTFSLLIFSTHTGLSGLEEMLSGKVFVASSYLTFSLVLFVLAIIGLLVWAIMKNALVAPEIIGFVVLTLLFGSLVFLTGSELFIKSKYNYSFDFFTRNNSLSFTGVVWAIVFNLGIFLELLGLILLGYLRKEEWLINFGAVFLFLLVVIKYFDWFFTSIDKSLFFIGAGLILFLVGWALERGRRLIIANIKDPNVQ